MKKISASHIIASLWLLLVIVVSRFMMKPVFHGNEILRLAVIIPIILLGIAIFPKIYQRFKKRQTTAKRSGDSAP